MSKTNSNLRHRLVGQASCLSKEVGQPHVPARGVSTESSSTSDITFGNVMKQRTHAKLKKRAQRDPLSYSVADCYGSIVTASTLTGSRR